MFFFFLISEKVYFLKYPTCVSDVNANLLVVFLDARTFIVGFVLALRRLKLVSTRAKLAADLY